MTRRFLPAWLFMVLLATTAMMPTVANAQPLSTQNRFRVDQNIRSRVPVRTNAYVNTAIGNRQPTYRPLRGSHGFSTVKRHSHRTVWTWGRNDRRR
jgi:hypothetical protein